MRRVVITGMGLVSPVGTGVEYAWKNLLAGKSGVRKVTEFDVSDLVSQIAGLPEYGTLPGQYNPDVAVSVKEQRKMDKAIMYGVVAATQAVQDAGLQDYSGDRERVGVSIGSGIGGLNTLYENCVEMEKNGSKFISP